VSSAPTGRASGIALSRERVAVALQGAAALAITAGFAFLAVRDVEQIRRLLWRPEEIPRALREAGGLATVYPGRFLVLVVGSVALMVAAEFRPRFVLEGSTAVWIGLGCVGTGAYLLGTLDIGTRWAIGAVLVAGAVAVGVVLSRTIRRPNSSAERVKPSRSLLKRSLLPVVVGTVGGLLAVRASIEPVTEWDAVIYHISFARDWLASLPGLPHAAGPSIGSELSYNYPALFPSMSVAVAAPLHLEASSVARLVSPLAALTIFAVLRASVSGSGLAAWSAPMFLLGSTFFVGYGQWPTAYMTMTLLLVLAIARLLRDRRLLPVTALCLGLLAVTGLTGMTFAAIVVLGYACSTLMRRRELPRVSLLSAKQTALRAVLLFLPIAVVALSSLRRTRGLFFPWISWPNAGHLLPHVYWSSAKREILANAYGQFGAEVGSFFAPLHGIATSGLLTPGGLVLEGLLAVLCGIAFARSSRAVPVGAATAVVCLVILVAARLVWLRYFIPLSVAAAVGLGLGIAALHQWHGGRITLLPYTAAVVAAGVSVLSGTVYALAGPNDRSPTATGSYRTERSSAFETARQASDTNARRKAVFGDDSRAWDDIGKLAAAGLSVGTFDIRNYYNPYVARLQLDGLAGAAITGGTASTVAYHLKRRGIDLVFVPSWFWEPGAGRDPLADRSPVALWVGSPRLRALRVYLPNENAAYPSVLYLVGDSPSVRRRVNAVLPSPRFSVEGPLSVRETTAGSIVDVRGPIGGSVRWRIGAPATESRGAVLRLTTRDTGAAPGVTVYEPRQPTLVEPAPFVACRGVAGWARESTLDLAFPGSPIGFASLAVGATGGTRVFRATVRELGTSNGRPLVRACGDPTTPRGGVFPAKTVVGRIIVEPSGSHPFALSLDYLDTGKGRVVFNAYDQDRGRWTYNVAHINRCGSGTWRHVELPVGRLAAAGSGVELGPFVAGDDFTVRNLRVVVGGGSQQVVRC
jgi:hypothetical protein